MDPTLLHKVKTILDIFWLGYAVNLPVYGEGSFHYVSMTEDYVLFPSDKKGIRIPNMDEFSFGEFINLVDLLSDKDMLNICAVTSHSGFLEVPTNIFKQPTENLNEIGNEETNNVHPHQRGHA